MIDITRTKNSLKTFITDLVDQFCIERGSRLIVSVNLLEIFKLFPGSRHSFADNAIFIYEQIKNKIGCSGTFITPVFNYQFCKGIDFHRRSTPGQSGSFGDILLKSGRLKRTKHPIYSFLVDGEDQNLFLNLDNKKAFGDDSPFSKFVDCGYKFITIGHHFIRSNTLVHFAESQAKINYRFEKNFTAKYYDYDEIESIKNFSMFVRNTELCDVSGITEKGLSTFYSEGAVRRIGDIKSITSYIVDQAKAYQIMYSDLINCTFDMVQCYKDPIQKNNVIFGGRVDEIEAIDKTILNETSNIQY